MALLMPLSKCCRWNMRLKSIALLRMRWRVPLANYSDTEKASINACSNNEATHAVYTAAVRDGIPIIYLDTHSELQILEGMYDAVIMVVAADSAVAIHDMTLRAQKNLFFCQILCAPICTIREKVLLIQPLHFI